MRIPSRMEFSERTPVSWRSAVRWRNAGSSLSKGPTEVGCWCPVSEGHILVSRFMQRAMRTTQLTKVRRGEVAVA